MMTEPAVQADQTALYDLMCGVGITDAPQWAKQVKLPYQPFPWQFQTMQQMFRYERFADFSDPGTGKTFPMQFAAVTYAFYGNKVCVVMPPTLCGQFAETFADFFVGIHDHLKIHLLDEPVKKREQLIAQWDEEGWPDILLMSYDMFRKYADQRRTFTKLEKVEGRPRPKKVKIPNPNWDRLKRAGYNVLIADEAHALKNPGSQIHQRFWEYVTDTTGEYILYLATGTPSGNTPEDTFGLIRLKTPEAYHSKRAFDRQHVILDNDSKFRHVLGFKNLDLLHTNLYQNAVRVSSEVFRTVPEPQIIEVKVNLERAHKKLYDQVIKQRMLDLPEGLIDAINDSKMRQLAKQLVSVPEMYTEKAPANALRQSMDTVIEGIDLSKKKVIIFAYYKATVAALAKHYEQFNPAVINGTSADKDANRKKFLEDDSCRVIVVNWQSGGAGLNLQSAAHYILFAEVPTVPKDAYQAIARADRSGQKHQVIAYFFRVMKTISGGHVRTLLKKDLVNNEVMRDKRKLLHELMGE
jgi:SWI/SNF-related matrix-associated actin-dependent regulator 1 of chromatin subfamily A